jgi:hypothetical protein
MDSLGTSFCIGLFCLTFLNLISKINRRFLLNITGYISVLVKSLKNTRFFGLSFGKLTFVLLVNLADELRLNNILKSESNISLLGQVLKKLIIPVKYLLRRVLLNFRSFFEFLQKTDNVFCQGVNERLVETLAGYKSRSHFIRISILSQINKMSLPFDFDS